MTQKRTLHTKLKSARGRTVSSQRWLSRQLNDPYVHQAKEMGFRSRAAFKLIEINDKFHFLKPGKKVVDLGAAPGGWTQVAVKYAGHHVVALDLLKMDQIAGATLIQGDFYASGDLIQAELKGLADVVLSDMAPSAIGNQSIDHLRIMGLVEDAFHFACQILAPGGTFVAKVFQGGTESTLLGHMKERFSKVNHMKPPSSRKDSAEMYVIAQGFYRIKKEDK